MRWPEIRRGDDAALTRWTPVVAVVGLAQLGLGLEERWTGSDLSLAASSLMLGLPLLLRRTAPLLACGLVATALVAQDALGGSLGFASNLAALVAAYSAGRHDSLPRAASGGVVLLGGVLLAMRTELATHAGEMFFPVFYVAAAVLIGRAVGRLAGQAVELRRLNDALAGEAEANARLAVATERMRLARELHDTVAHTLTVVVVQAEGCEQAIHSGLPEPAGRAARAVQEAGRRGLADLRSMVRVLRDTEPSTEGPGLQEIETLAAVLAGAGVDVVVRREGDLSGVPEDVGRDLTRIVQEALTNVVRHSAASSADVLLAADASAVEATVVDPGPRLDSSLPTGGHGIAGMTERAAAHGGTVHAAPVAAGFQVIVRIPLVGVGEA